MERADHRLQRCAIYTRKSSEQGLEQDFNSLHAQREACEAFIHSQQGEGWRLVKTAYDDGGLSGATIERPALKRLLADIRERQVNVVVVYKVDRLTRSLADFARMVELFDAQGVSFVAVTQQFNTTTSMGRLTLNVLLSFAQFEREVTGERIRDKIAASKRKGMWMGGIVPLGYELRQRRLVINQAEAEVVRQIFCRYLELGSVRLLKQDLDRRGMVSKLRPSSNGSRSGGCSFSRGALYGLLANPLYIGEIRHKRVRHPGQHRAIVERDLWDRVQEQLRQHTVRRTQGQTKAAASPLAGKLFDPSGACLSPTHAVKGERRYRYYVSRALLQGAAAETRSSWRLPAREIECSVALAAREILDDRPAIATAAAEHGVAASQIHCVLEAADGWSKRLGSETDAAPGLAESIERVELSSNGLRLSVKLALPAGDHPDGQTPPMMTITRFVPMTVKRRGVETRLVVEHQGGAARAADRALLKAIARARRWLEALVAGRAQSISELARREGITARYVRRLIRLGFLAPEIVEAVVEGRQPAELSAETLTRRGELPLDWQQQLDALGF